MLSTKKGLHLWDARSFVLVTIIHLACLSSVTMAMHYVLYDNYYNSISSW